MNSTLQGMEICRNADFSIGFSVLRRVRFFGRVCQVDLKVYGKYHTIQCTKAIIVSSRCFFVLVFLDGDVGEWRAFYKPLSC